VSRCIASALEVVSFIKFSPVRGVGWDGMGRDGAGWGGMGRDGTGWDEMR
jgi:hypothetical protein